ncbi:metal ABC transporter solute-binding protein, Zn/Mn family [Corynebacterium liangguodongii]|uniref:ABC transporter substrate-binding protein n=1 Tax=Corynebacterium liangguodongii TaxID=2079535 RepID=A0A2S0WFT0_9CORY|nr:zinc ABC transporter substrate-binding protein [Corynebacterium liangguodongii]AWB84638.1 ABC transporter substrate-binding protein [Corynebacterium liangguodongii]PWB99646.1 ABC transporter substrate-binding protein [Corynebacterium liangguodongii]
MLSTTPMRAASLAVAASASLFIASCSAGNAPSDNAAPQASGSPEAKTTTVVATTNVWADVAGAVLGEEVPAVISNPATDPHEFEPSAADLAKVTEAGLLVANGGAYDNAIYSAADPANVISAIPLVDGAHAHAGHDHAGHDHAGHDHASEEMPAGHEGESPEEHAAHAGHDHAGHDHADGENEHVWYDTKTVREVADKLAADAEKEGHDADTAEVTKRLDAIQSKLDALPGARVAQTHPIADAIIEATALNDVTPAEFRQATLNENEPASSSVAELITMIENGEVDLVINNPQTPDALTERILEAAKAKGVAVVDIAETPQGGADFFDYFDEIAASLAEALKA